MSETALKNNSIITKIHSLIAGIVPCDEIEEASITDILAWIESGVPIFRIQKPDTPNKHLVSYFVLFDEENKKILLVDHKKAQLWLPPGGHVEVDEDPTETVRRECVEELGIEADFWSDDPILLAPTLTVGIGAGHIDVNLWYVLRGDSNASYQYDKEEFRSVRWFGFDEIPYEKSDPHLKRFITKFRKQVMASVP